MAMKNPRSKKRCRDCGVGLGPRSKGGEAIYVPAIPKVDPALGAVPFGQEEWFNGDEYLCRPCFEEDEQDYFLARMEAYESEYDPDEDYESYANPYFAPPAMQYVAYGRRNPPPFSWPDPYPKARSNPRYPYYTVKAQAGGPSGFGGVACKHEHKTIESAKRCMAGIATSQDGRSGGWWQGLYVAEVRHHDDAGRYVSRNPYFAPPAMQYVAYGRRNPGPFDSPTLDAQLPSGGGYEFHPGGAHTYQGEVYTGSGRYHHHDRPPEVWHPGGGVEWGDDWHAGGGHYEANNPGHPHEAHPHFYAGMGWVDHALAFPEESEHALRQAHEELRHHAGRMNPPRLKPRPKWMADDHGRPLGDYVHLYSHGNIPSSVEKHPELKKVYKAFKRTYQASDARSAFYAYLRTIKFRPDVAASLPQPEPPMGSNPKSKRKPRRSKSKGKFRPCPAGCGADVRVSVKRHPVSCKLRQEHEQGGRRRKRRPKGSNPKRCECGVWKKSPSQFHKRGCPRRG